MREVKKACILIGASIAVGLAWAPIDARAATVEAASCERAAVQATMDDALDGDTLSIPACACEDERSEGHSGCSCTIL